MGFDGGLNPTSPAPGVRRFTVPLAFASPDHLHVHVLQTSEGDLLIDTGTVGSEAALRAGLAAVGAVPTRVLITHGHVDHWGLARLLADRVLAHPGVLPTLHFGDSRYTADWGSGAPSQAELEAAFGSVLGFSVGVPQIVPLAEGDRIDDWMVLATPGHDDGHICLYREHDAVLLCGDLLLPGFTPNIQPSYTGEDALANFLASLERTARLPVSLVLPAHGEAYTDASGRAAALQAHHAHRLASVNDALRGGPRLLSDITREVFGARDLSVPDRLMADLETYAHLDHLRRRGQIVLGDDEHWSAVASRRSH